jgi:beta-glucosidase
MITFPIGPTATDFIWAGGIEDTFIPQTRPHHRALDEYELMGHYDHWREDLALIRDSGMTAVRWGIPWYRVESQQGVFNWEWTDQVIPYMVEELGVTPIIDLMHYGCPLWLKGEFANPNYPEAVATYAAAFVARYGHLVRWYTPLNEPLVNAMMCGRRGLWPPYLRGDRGYVRVMMAITTGIFRTVAAIRALQPDAVMVYVEAAGLSRAAHESLDAFAREDELQNFLCFDLLTGRVTPEHPLFTWLVRNGVSTHLLAHFVHHPLTLDIMGLNFYPQWSTRQAYLNRRGQLAYRVIEKQGSGFAEMLERYYRRYNVPLMVTETSAFGSDSERADWLDASLVAIKQLRSQGVPVLGYTWFPLFTMIDWRYRYGSAPIEAYHLQLGLYRLNPTPSATRWHPTPLVAQFRAHVHQPEQSIGALTLSPSPLLPSL